MKLTIAIEPQYEWLEKTIKEQLKFNNIVFDLLYVEHPYKTLLNEASVIVKPLQECPFALPTGIIITALSQRESAAFALIICKNSVQEEGVLGMPEQAKVAVSHQIIEKQLRPIFPNIEISIHENNIEVWKNNAFDAYVIPEYYLPFFNTEMYNIYPLQVSEFVPPAGQGALAWLCLEDDLPTRRLLKNMHHSATAKITNTERRIQKEWSKKNINGFVHCEKDSLEYYHLHSVILDENNQLIKEKQSSSSIASWALFA